MAQIFFSSTVTLDQNAAVLAITIDGGSALNASSYTITLSGDARISGTFNAGTSTVKLSDTDHLLKGATFYNLQWDTAPTAPRTLTIEETVDVTNTLNIDGTPTNPVTLAGTGNFNSTVTVNNCAGKPASMTNVTCNPPSTPPGPTVSASVESPIVLALTFLGMMLIAVYKMRKNRQNLTD